MRARSPPQMHCLHHEIVLSEMSMWSGCSLAWTHNRVECTEVEGPERERRWPWVEMVDAADL